MGERARCPSRPDLIRGPASSDPDQQCRAFGEAPITAG